MTKQQVRESICFSLLCAGIFCAVIAAKFAYSPRLSPATQGINGLLKLRHVDYLFIGSSRTRQGYDVKAIERATGGTVYLLAYDGLQPHLIVNLLGYLLNRRQPTIGTIILEAYPYVAVRNPSVEDPRIFYDAPAPLKLGLLKTWQRTGMHLTDIYALAAVEGNEVLLTSFCTRKLIERRTYHGGYVDKKTSGMPRARFNAIQEPEGIRQSDGCLTPLQAQSLRQVFALARWHQVPLIMVEPPVPQRIGHGRVYTAARAQLYALASASQVPYRIFDARLFNPRDNTLFTDPLHTSSKGRALLSKLIVPTLLSASGKSLPLLARKAKYPLATQPIKSRAMLPRRHAPMAFIGP